MANSWISTLDITKDISSPLQLVESLDETKKLTLKALNNQPWDDNDMMNQTRKRVEMELLFQICMIEDISKSKLSQIDEIKGKLNPKSQKVDKLEISKKLVTSIDIECDQSSIKDFNNDIHKSTASHHIYKLTLQDKDGKLFYAVNLELITGLRVCMLGSKIIILPGAIFHRGIFFFTNATIKVLYGMIPSWNADREHKICSYLQSRMESEIQPRKNNKKRKIQL